ncbi:FAD-dependent oxidoreductase [Luteibacter sp. PPL201]|uniref:FAD-dependent oxidoreductase n=1 Tax=Luteibacter sahnii TaxID=3021977 RepID=A0ABT6BCI8_9GAMM
MTSYDLIVVGAGIVGAACAEYASAEGLRVAVVEPGTIGGGATAAAMGHLVAMDDHPDEFALSTYSLALWERFADLPQAEFSRCGTLWVASTDDELARIPGKVARLAAGGVQAALIDAAELYEREPALAPGLAGGMRVATEAVVFPPAVARHLIDDALRRGARLHVQSVLRVERGGVTLRDGSRLHGPVLVATGGYLPRLLPDLPVRGRKGHLVITDRYPAIVHHQLLEMGYADSAHGADASSVAFNVQPRPTGQILIGSSREYDAHDGDVSMPMVRRMLERSFRFLPGLRDLNAIRVWTGFRPVTPDGLPYLGRVPGMRDTWVAAGHEGLGVTTSLGSARVVVDQLLGRVPAIDARAFDPARAFA